MTELERLAAQYGSSSYAYKEGFKYARKHIADSLQLISTKMRLSKQFLTPKGIDELLDEIRKFGDEVK